MSRPLGSYLSEGSTGAQSRTWETLYRKALRMAENTSDSRADLLKAHRSSKERVLKMLSLVSDSDLHREFGQ